MKYIGNKSRLIDFINRSLIASNILPENKIVLDLFAGTGAVSLFFKSKNCHVTSVDFMNYSIDNMFYFNKFNEEPNFDELSDIIDSPSLSNVFCYLLNNDVQTDDYYFNNYSPAGLSNRQYFSNKNGHAIDRYMTNLELIKNKLSDEKYRFLKGAGLNAFDRVANIAGTYGSYLKIWRSMALKDISLIPVKYINGGNVEIIKNDVITFLKGKRHFDIVYMDPPYNERQYAPNFHVLENISCNDKPLLLGKTGIRKYEDQISQFCSKKNCINEFRFLVELLDTDVFVMSYSNEGIMKVEDILRILKTKFKSVDVYEYNYRRFKTNSWTEKETGLKELLFVSTN